MFMFFFSNLSKKKKVDDEFMNYRFCESVFEDDNDENFEQEIHSNEKLFSD